MRATLLHRLGLGLYALWLGAATPLLCVPGLTSNHDHGAHTVFEAPHTHAGDPVPSASDPMTLGETSNWIDRASPGSGGANVLASMLDAGAALPVAPSVAITPASPSRAGRDPRAARTTRPRRPWRPPQLS